MHNPVAMPWATRFFTGEAPLGRLHDVVVMAKARLSPSEEARRLAHAKQA